MTGPQLIGRARADRHRSRPGKRHGTARAAFERRSLGGICLPKEAAAGREPDVHRLVKRTWTGGVELIRGARREPLEGAPVVPEARLTRRLALRSRAWLEFGREGVSEEEGGEMR